jgi:hypothetical protein
MTFTQYFGLASDSKEIARLFDVLNTVQTPFLDEDDIEEGRYTDWVLLKRKGIEFGFSNKAWHEGDTRLAWGANDLILTQMYFYSGSEDVQPYTGKLPYGLSFNDNRETARSKLIEFEAARHSYITDCWDTEEGFRLTIFYKETGEIETVFLYLKLHNLKNNVHHLKLADLEICFNQPVSDKLSCLSKLNTPISKESWDEWFETRELTLTDDYGIELYLGEDKPEKLSAIKFFAPRERESVGWNGLLPLNLSFEDNPQSLFEKIKTKPAKHQNNRLTGYSLWHFEIFSLHVLYSNLYNRLLRITVMAPGYWKD